MDGPRRRHLGVLRFFALGTALAYGEERVPRHGFRPDLRRHRAPWWTWLAFAVGFGSMMLASLRLTAASESPWRYLACFLPGVVASWLLQMTIISWRNRRSMESDERGTQRP